MDSLMLVVARGRPDVYRRQGAHAHGPRRVLRRDEPLTAVVERNPGAGLAFFTALVREFSLRLSATDDLVSEVTRWGLEASGFDTGDDDPPRGTDEETR